MESFEERVRALYLDPRWLAEPKAEVGQRRLNLAAATYANNGRYEQYLELRDDPSDGDRKLFELAHKRVLDLMAEAEDDALRPSLTWVPNAPARLSILRGEGAATILVSRMFVFGLRGFVDGWRCRLLGDCGPCGTHSPHEYVEAMATLALAAAVHPAYDAFATHGRCRDCRHRLNVDRELATALQAAEREVRVAAFAFVLLHEVGHAARGDLDAPPDERRRQDEIAADGWALERIGDLTPVEVCSDAMTAVLLLAAARDALDDGLGRSVGIGRRRLEAGLAWIAERFPGTVDSELALDGLEDVVATARRLQGAIDPRTLFVEGAA